eukprot:750448-Hanusia_phi.AAC.8
MIPPSLSSSLLAFFLLPSRCSHRGSTQSANAGRHLPPFPQTRLYGTRRGDDLSWLYSKQFVFKEFPYPTSLSSPPPTTRLPGLCLLPCYGGTSEPLRSAAQPLASCRHEEQSRLIVLLRVVLPLPAAVRAPLGNESREEGAGEESGGVGGGETGNGREGG